MATKSSPAKAKSADKTDAPAPAAKKSPAKKPPAKKTASKTDDSLYTDPALRHRLKDKIQAGDKGGKPGQWSARKSQLLVSEYEKEGGGYNKKGRSDQQKNLEKWTEEKWTTADGKKAVHGKETSRYLPEKAWEELTPAQRKATDDKKKAGSHTGKQNIENTAPAKRARKSAVKP